VQTEQTKGQKHFAGGGLKEPVERRNITRSRKRWNTTGRAQKTLPLRGESNSIMGAEHFGSIREMGDRTYSPNHGGGGRKKRK